MPPSTAEGPLFLVPAGAACGNYSTPAVPLRLRNWVVANCSPLLNIRLPTVVLFRWPALHLLGGGMQDTHLD